MKVCSLQLESTETYQLTSGITLKDIVPSYKNNQKGIWLQSVITILVTIALNLVRDKPISTALGLKKENNDEDCSWEGCKFTGRTARPVRLFEAQYQQTFFVYSKEKREYPYSHSKV